MSNLPFRLRGFPRRRIAIDAACGAAIAAILCASSAAAFAESSHRRSLTPSVVSNTQAAANDDVVERNLRGDEPSAQSDPERASLRLKNAMLVGGGVGIVYLYGLTSWWGEGFGGGFKTRNEGWFGRDTDHGGTDKLGHFQFTYAGSRLLKWGFEAAGNDERTALKLGTLTAYGALSGVEFIDGFSKKWSFSREDFAMNTLGAAAAVLLETQPKIDAIFDLRFNYWPSRSVDGSRRSWEPISDYAGQTYYLVTKASGFDTLQSVPVVRYLELAVGYGARGFETGGARERYEYLGVSLNLSQLLNDTILKNAGPRTVRTANTLFEHVQFETTTLARERRIP